MVKIQYYLPESSDFSLLKQQLIQSGILDKTNESIYKMAPEAVDPAILSRGSLSYRRYTKSALLLLRDDILSRCKPSCSKNSRLVSLSIWKPVQPLYSSKQGGRSGGNSSNSRNFKSISNRHVGGSSSSIAITTCSSSQTSHHNTDHQSISSSDLLPAFMKRRMVCSTSSTSINPATNDLKEENEKELETGVLTNYPKKESSFQLPPPSNQEREGALRDRRIGSGRLLPRDLNSDLTFDSASNTQASSLSVFRKYGRTECDRDSTRENLDSKYSFNTSSDSLTGGDSNEHSHQHRQRRCSQPILEEPEWYTAGPTSKHDTIELRGFDENDDAHYYESLKSSEHKKEEQEKLERESEQNERSCKHLIGCIETLQSNNALEVPDESGAVLSGTLSPPARSTPTKLRDNTSDNPDKDEVQNKSTVDSEHNKNQEKQIEENVDGILKEDSFHSLDGQKKTEINSSRFSQWFRKGDHSQKTSGQRISFYEERNNMGNESQNRQNGVIETGSYFPQSSTSNEQGTTFLEFLQKDNVMRTGDKQKAGMISNVEELEARMRENGVGSKTNCFKSNNMNFQHVPPINMNTTTGMPGPHQKDMKAFKKILEQLIPGVANPIGMNVLTAALHQNQQSQILQQMINRNKQDEIKKALLQQQQQCNFQMRVNDLLLKIANKQVTWNDVLKRPEAYAVLRGLARGDYTEAALLHQISSPNVSARYREVIVTILNYLNQSSRVASTGLGIQQMFSQIPGQQQMHFQPVHGQQLPDNNKAGLQKIPSPRELQHHTQIIMQSALIKKKIEQQQENFRYREELQKQQQYQELLQHGINPLKEDNFHFSHCNSAHAQKQHSQNNLSTPLTFTPTSVLRKMTGEKDNNILLSNTAAAVENLKATNKVMQPLSTLDTGDLQQQFDCRRMILGGGSNAQKQTFQNQDIMAEISRKVPQQNNNHREDIKNNSIKYNTAGRPILKGSFMPLQSSSQYVQEKSPTLKHANGTALHQMQSTYAEQQSNNISNLNVGNDSIEENTLNEYQSNNGGTLSEANELARWFSPELLARATAGQLPSLNMEQTLSSKDVEQSIQNSSAHI